MNDPHAHPDCDPHPHADADLHHPEYWDLDFVQHSSISAALRSE